MADDLLQATFDATLDEVVDVGMRLSTGTAAYQRQRVRAQWQFGVVFVVAATYVFVSRRGHVSGLEWLILATVLLPVGAGMVFGYRWFHDWYTRRAYRRMVAELLGGVAQVRCDFAVCEDRLLCKTPHGETALPWSRAICVHADGSDLEMWFDPGLAIVRARAFRSLEHRAAFVAAVTTRVASALSQRPV